MRNSFISNQILLLFIFVLQYYFSYAYVRHIHSHSTAASPDLSSTIGRIRANNALNDDDYPAQSSSHTQSFMRNQRVVLNNQMVLSGANNFIREHITSNDAHPGTARGHFPAESNFISPVYFDVDETTQNKMQSQGRAKRSKGREKGLVRHLARTFNIPDEIYERTPDLIRRHGYPAEEHYVTTADGYIIAVHRIPAPRLPPEGAANPNVVLLMSCGVCSSADYVFDEPEHSLGFVLANAGYDVWLGNVRGNFYSRNHTKLNPDTDKRFWRFSYDEIAKFDLPAQVSFIRRHTGVDKIFYIGHSSSTLTFFMSAAGRNSFVDKVRLMVAMSPIAYRGNSTGLTAISMQIMAILQVPLETLGTGELYQRSSLLNSLLYLLCNERSVIQDTCVSLFTSLSGGHNAGLINKPKLPTLLSHMLSGVSARMLAHLGQLITAPGLQMFDFGPRGNHLRYSRSTPPLYSVRNVTCPTLLYWSSNDKPNSPKDIARLAADLPNLVRSTKVNDSTFGHLDFIFAHSARTLIYEDMLQVMRSY